MNSMLHHFYYNLTFCCDPVRVFYRYQFSQFSRGDGHPGFRIFQNMRHKCEIQAIAQPTENKKVPEFEILNDCQKL